MLITRSDDGYFLAVVKCTTPLFIAEGDADGAGGVDDFSIGLDEAHGADGVADGDGVDVVGLVADHVAVFGFFDEFDGFDAKAGA